MRSKIYAAGIAGVVVLLALGFQLLPSPWQGGAAGWFSALWYLAALAAGLGYWYKYDAARSREKLARSLKEARRAAAGKNRARREHSGVV
ncbi:MAG: hypothetical protein GX090_00505 [Firmicutes bacterium]|nr:hypothetical protein [Bacillota bacterium]HOB34885.1 hypothetical protein [Bacillota bacterium]HPZ90371.1 hypothetical protein [Bacillota bacterium]HQE02469.1 hypothetical protein [Bacillota bacterium]